jgi:rhamnopyranosyl-N-acetylglucosaminyl-diphospho-decaprenol beta-1,3/1,4-galactofuranosyltransferase
VASDESRDVATDVVALVLTHNAPASLGRCLEAIGLQELPPEAVIVVDNASTPPVDGLSLCCGSVPVRVVRSERNTGPAGGWAQALREFLDSSWRLAWVLDDDMVPDSDCLRRLRERVDAKPDRAFTFPRTIDVDGTIVQYPSWCGFLVARAVIAAAGLPMEELFWWAEDTEYLRFRIPRAGFSRHNVAEAHVRHDGVRQGGPVPVWKYYYEARNMLYLHTRVMRKVGWYPRNTVKLVGRAVRTPGGGRVRRLAAIGRGMVDGALGHLGTTYPVGTLRERSPSPATPSPSSTSPSSTSPSSTGAVPR